MMQLITPLIMAVVGTAAVFQRRDLFGALTEGAAEGLHTVVRILPSLVIMLPAIYMLRASGALEALSKLMAPVFGLLGIPGETSPLVFLRPFSGSGALAVASEIISEYGADSIIGRTAAVMMGSTETTFYVITVYFGAVGIKKSRHAIPAALCADLAGFIAASWTVRLFWG